MPLESIQVAADRHDGLPEPRRTLAFLTVALGIVMAVRNVADPKGNAASVDMEALRIAVRTALLGWNATGTDPFEFAAGGLLAFRDGHLWWQDSYRTAYDISN